MARNSHEDRSAERSLERPAAGGDGASVTRLSDHGWITGRKKPLSPAMRQLDELIEHPGQIERVSPVELHRLFSELGLADAGPLFELISPEQLRYVVDLQIWKHDRMDPNELLDWLAAIAHLVPDKAGEHLGTLDVELVGFLLRTRAKIYLAGDDDVPDEPEGAFHGTPDGFFVLDLLGETETTNEQLAAIIDALYRDDPEGARRLLQTIMGELPSELEELSLRWRNARLEDLGFADAHEALRIYSFLDPATVDPDESTADRWLRVDPDPLPHGDLATVLPADGSFWSRASAQVSDAAESARLGDALLHLANLNLSADRVDVADRDAAAKSLAHLRGRLSLGLEHLCGGTVERAASVLRHVALMRVARLGHSLVLQRQRRLVPWLREGRLGRRPRSLDMLTSPLRERLQSLMATRPYLLEDDGQVRPFSALADLRIADALVDEAIASAALVPRAVWPAELPVGVTLAALFCTEVANRWLERDGPFDREALVALIERLREPSGLSQLEQLAQAVAADRPEPFVNPSSHALSLRWLAEMGAALSRLSPDTFDLRFVDSLLVAP